MFSRDCYGEHYMEKDGDDLDDAAGSLPYATFDEGVEHLADDVEHEAEALPCPSEYGEHRQQ